MSSSENPVYQEEVLDFLRSASEFCTCLEEVSEQKIGSFVKRLNLALPGMYSAAIALPELDARFGEFGQRFIDEQDYGYLRSKLSRKLGEYDAFEEVFDNNRIEFDDAVGASISEYLADIYQDVKDFLLLYHLGSEEVMYEAIWEVQQSFSNFWGQKVVNVLRAVHNLNYSGDVLEENPGKTKENNNFNTNDTSNWIISRRMKDRREDE